jgi:hypothetical protein
MQGALQKTNINFCYISTQKIRCVFAPNLNTTPVWGLPLLDLFV